MLPVFLYALRKDTCPGYISGGGGERGGWDCPAESPNPLEEARFDRGTWVHGFTEEGGRVSGPVFGVGGDWRIKRWGIEGIRIGTSDRFGGEANVIEMLRRLVERSEMTCSAI